MHEPQVYLPSIDVPQGALIPGRVYSNFHSRLLCYGIAELDVLRELCSANIVLIGPGSALPERHVRPQSDQELPQLWPWSFRTSPTTASVYLHRYWDPKWIVLKLILAFRTLQNCHG